MASSTAETLGRLSAQLRSSVVVRPETLRFVLVALLARGHILLEDVPGVGKTLLARSLATAVGGQFHRIQFTSDLLPADITGGNIFDPRTAEFSFRAGPVFANVVLADEINRGTPRAQSSLLEAMGEQHVTVDGDTHPLPDPFLVIATQNPVEQYGTFPLPESELDRFMVQLHLGHPDAAATDEILQRHEHRSAAQEGVAVLGPGQLRAMQDEVLDVAVSAAVRGYIGALVIATREHPAVGLPASARATVALLRAAQAHAVLETRHHLLPDDVKAVAVAVLAHRLGVAGDGPEVVRTILATVPVPV